ncbi:MAG: leucine-rich repeat protein [Ruminococcus sp.]|nr:leucine-rich repeat protein [Ruminococcus sp.]
MKGKTIKRAAASMLALLIVTGNMPMMSVSDLFGSAVVTASAETLYNGTCGDNAVWSLDSDGKLTISGSGAMTDYGSEADVPWYNYRDGITSVEIGAEITSVGTWAFSHCSALRTVTFAEGSELKTISNWSFSYSGLTSLSIPSSVTFIGNNAFFACETLTTVNILVDADLDTIGSGAFFGCGGLTSINIPKNVKEIGAGAFGGCHYMTDVYCYAKPDGLTWTGATDSFITDGDKTVCHVPAEYYGTYVERFGQDNDNKVNVKFTTMDPNGNCGDNAVWKLFDTNEDGTFDKLTISGSGAMTDYTNEESVPWNNYRGGITSVEIGAEITSVGSNAFYDCSGLTSITIPDSVTSIGYDTFRNCTNLTDLTYGGSALQWANLTGGADLGIPAGCTMTYLKKDVVIDGYITNGTVTADKTIVSPDEEVILTVTPDADYVIKSVSVNDGDVTLTDNNNGTYSFTMPGEDVTVTAEFETIDYNKDYNISITAPVNGTITAKIGDTSATTAHYGDTVTLDVTPNAGCVAKRVSVNGTAIEPVNGVYSFTMPAKDVTVTATFAGTVDLATLDGDYTAQDGDVLTGSTSYMVTIADGAGITLSDATVNGGIVCEGTAEITIVGTNSVVAPTYGHAGIQIGPEGTTLTITGTGSLNSTGDFGSAGIGLNSSEKTNQTGGNIVIESGTITATGGRYGAGIGTGWTGVWTNPNSATIGNITIKGGNVTAVGGDNAAGIGKGSDGSGYAATIGTIAIYDNTGMVEATSISETITYMHIENETETDVTESKTDYFTIIEDGDRRIITPKADTDYTITIADGIEHGTITAKIGDTSAAKAHYGDTVTLDVIPDTGYAIKSVSVNGGAVTVTDNNDGTYSFTMPGEDVTVTAEFEAIDYNRDYNISITAPVNGTITAKIGDTSATTAHSGDTVTLDVIPDTGYVVKSVSVNGGAVDVTNNNDGTYSFAMPAEDVTVSAKFLGEHSFTALQALIDATVQGGTLTLDRDYIGESIDYALVIPAGKTITIDLNGHTIDRRLSGSSLFSDGYVIKVEGDLTLTDSSEGQTGKITGGSNSGDGGGVIVDYNGSFTMTGGSISGNSAGFLYADLHFGGGVFVNGTFVMAGGSISGNEAHIGGGVFVGDNGTFTMTGGTISGNRANGSGGVLAGGPFVMTGGTISGNTAQVSGGADGSGTFYLKNGVEVSDVKGTVIHFGSVTISDTKHGTITPSDGTLPVLDKKYYIEDKPVTLTVTPDAGYKLKSLTVVDKDNYEITVTNNEFKMPQSNVTVTAEFEIIDYNIGITAPANGTVTAAVGEDANAETAHYRDTVTLTAVPDEGYVFKTFSVKDSNDNIVPVENDQFTMPADNVTVTAEFEAIDYNISITAPTNGTVTAAVGETINAETAHYGDTVILTATPDEGYALKSFTVKDSNDNITPVENDQFTMPADNVTVTAVFKRVFDDGIGAKLTGYSLSLDGDIGVNFYMELDEDVVADDGAYMLFTLPDNSTQKVYVNAGEGRTAAYKDITLDPTKTYYVFKCNVAAKEMNDTISAKIVTTQNGQTKETTPPYTYSVKQYAEDLTARESDNTVLCDLVDAMLYFGTVSQDAFGHNTENPANDGKGYTGAEWNYNSTFEKPDLTNAGIEYYGSSLMLETKVSERHYFKVTGDIKDFTFTIDGKSVDPVQYEGDPYYWYIQSEQVKAEDLGRSFKIEVIKGTKTIISYDYSPMDYVSLIFVKYDDENNKWHKQAKALYWYWKAAEAYRAAYPSQA